MLIPPVGVLPGGLLLHLGGLGGLKPGAVLSAVCIRPAANVSGLVVKSLLAANKPLPRGHSSCWYCRSVCCRVAFCYTSAASASSSQVLSYLPSASGRPHQCLQLWWRPC